MNKEQSIMPVSEKKKASNYKWNKQNMTIVAVSVRNEVKEQFKVSCEQNGTTMNAVLLNALRDYIAKAEQNEASTADPLPDGWRRTAPSVIRTFRSADGWVVDIEQTADTYGAWISHKDYDTKSFMFGVDATKHTLDEFCGLVFANLDDNIAIYKEDYMDE